VSGIRRLGRLPRAAAAVLLAALLAIAAVGWLNARAARNSDATVLHARRTEFAVHVNRAVPATSPACDPTASLRPTGPPTVTSGSFMAKIRARGYLIAGVDESTYHFGYLNPFDNQIEGFDVDMVHAIAQAIFGNPNQVRFVVVSDDQRIPAVMSGAVDIVAHTMTITCARWQVVDFSTVYFNAQQRVLVLRSSPAQSLADVFNDNGKVCATTGSTSLSTIDASMHSAGYAGLSVAVPYWTDCLVLLQQGAVAAISTDDSILAGLEAQDPFTKIIGWSLSPEPYGLAIAKQHADFVRFVNAVLARMRSDGQWAALYKKWIPGPVPPPPPAHYQA
jgi:polar amino acid transport system substrate-binding protein